MRNNAVKNIEYFEDEIIRTYSDIPEEDRIDIADNLKEKNSNISTLRNSKNKKYFEEDIKKENNKTISEEDAIDIISNLNFNRL